jgi:hypothetical protein
MVSRTAVIASSRILPGCDLDPVGVRDAEPLLGHHGHRGAAILDGVLVVNDVALHSKIRPIGDVDGPPFTQRSDHGLLYRGHRMPVSVFDLHRVAHPEHPLLDLQQLGVTHAARSSRSLRPPMNVPLRARRLSNLARATTRIAQDRENSW